MTMSTINGRPIEIPRRSGLDLAAWSLSSNEPAGRWLQWCWDTEQVDDVMDVAGGKMDKMFEGLVAAEADVGRDDASRWAAAYALGIWTGELPGGRRWLSLGLLGMGTWPRPLRRAVARWLLNPDGLLRGTHD